jgi:hypothetical protein
MPQDHASWKSRRLLPQALPSGKLYKAWFRFHLHSWRPKAALRGRIWTISLVKLRMTDLDLPLTPTLLLG